MKNKYNIPTGKFKLFSDNTSNISHIPFQWKQRVVNATLFFCVRTEHCNHILIINKIAKKMSQKLLAHKSASATPAETKNGS